jgi:replicative DNA helicase
MITATSASSATSPQSSPTQQALDKLKVPPHSIEAEQAILGGLMIENVAWENMGDKITFQDFYRQDHQMIFQAIATLLDQNKPADVITVSEFLTQQNQLTQIGGLAYLGELAKNTPTAANISAYAEIIRERSILRSLISVSSEITELAFQPQGKISAEILDIAEQKVFNIAEQGSKTEGPQNIRKVVAHALDNIEKRFGQSNPITGIASGFNDLDRITAGLQEGDLIIIAGRPSMGKTSLAMNIAEHAAIKSQKAVLVFSMEMPSESLATRMMSSLGRIDQSKLRTGRLQEEDWTRLTSAVGLLSEAKLYIDETPALSPMEVRSRARRIARENPLGLIVIDYLQLMRVTGHAENRTAEISEISRSLKALAKELRVPVIALSQLNRSLEQRPNKRPVMSDLRESGAIEQDADLIAFVYRDEVYNEDSPEKGIAEIIIGKHRNGPIGVVKLTFLGQYTRFENFASPNAFMPA